VRRLRALLSRQAGGRGHRGDLPDERRLPASGCGQLPLRRLPAPQDSRARLRPADARQTAGDQMAPADLRLCAAPRRQAVAALASPAPGRSGERASGRRFRSRAGRSRRNRGSDRRSAGLYPALAEALAVVARAEAERLLDPMGRPTSTSRPLVASYLRGWPTAVLVSGKD